MRFSELPAMIERDNISPITGVLFDFGLNSAQLDDDSRGFSFSGPARSICALIADHGQPVSEAHR